MTLAELLLTACFALFLYKLLRPLQRRLEAALLRFFSGNRPNRFQIIDADPIDPDRKRHKE